MRDIHNLVQHFSERYHKQVQQLCEPLMTHLGIHYFCFQRVNTKGQWTILSSNPDWIHYSAEQQFYLHDPSLIDPTRYQSGINFPDTHHHESFQSTLATHARDVFNLHHSLAIIDRQQAHCDFYFFAAPAEHQQMMNIYINNTTSLRYHFSDYFKREMHSTITRMDDYAVDLSTIKPDAYTSEANVLDIQPQLDYFDPYAQLSPRERTCVESIKKGKTAKQIALHLGISYRTVQAHIYNLKQKLGIQHIRELLK